MNEGRVARSGIQLWAANRYYYQKTVPRKDSLILMNCNENSPLKKKFIERLLNYDELHQVTAWRNFCKAVELPEQTIDTDQFVLPGVKFAVDNHLNFCMNATFEDSLTSCVTDTFGPEFHTLRLEKWKKNYRWIQGSGFEQFMNNNSKLNHFNGKAEVNDFIIDHILDHYKTHEQQLRALSIINYKLNVLWCILDAVQLKYMFFGDNLSSGELSTSELFIN